MSETIVVFLNEELYSFIIILPQLWMKSIPQFMISFELSTQYTCAHNFSAVFNLCYDIMR